MPAEGGSADLMLSTVLGRLPVVGALREIAALLCCVEVVSLGRELLLSGLAVEAWQLACLAGLLYCVYLSSCDSPQPPSTASYCTLYPTVALYTSVSSALSPGCDSVYVSTWLGDDSEFGQLQAG